jgi:hypothetical protein
VLGIHGGGNASTIYGIPSLEKNYDVNIKLKSGFTAGACIQFKIISRFSLCAELNFEKKGNSSEAPATNEVGEHVGDFHSRTSLNYFTLPLLFRYKLHCKKLEYYFQLGPYIGYLKNGKTQIDAIGEFPGLTYEEHMEYFQRIDYGLTASMGLAIPFSKKIQLPVEVRYNVGLHRLADEVPSDNSKVYNESFALLVGLQYNF